MEVRKTGLKIRLEPHFQGGVGGDAREILTFCFYYGCKCCGDKGVPFILPHLEKATHCVANPGVWKGDAEYSAFPDHISGLRQGDGPIDIVHEKSDS